MNINWYVLYLLFGYLSWFATQFQQATRITPYCLSIFLYLIHKTSFCYHSHFLIFLTPLLGIKCLIVPMKFEALKFYFRGICAIAVKPVSSPWFTPACSAAIATKKSFFQHYQLESSDHNRQLFFSARYRCKCVINEVSFRW